MCSFEYIATKDSNAEKLFDSRIPSVLSSSFSLTVTDTDVRPEARTLQTAQLLILVFAVPLRSKGDLIILNTGTNLPAVL